MNQSSIIISVIVCLISISISISIGIGIYFYILPTPPQLPESTPESTPENTPESTLALAVPSTQVTPETTQVAQSAPTSQTTPVAASTSVSTPASTNWAGNKFSTNGRCGPNFGNTACSGTQCCSIVGWCGGVKGGTDPWCGRLHGFEGKFDGQKP